nr:MAG TPA: hypothetical protein [Caudoviricetes sp.]
MYCVSIHNKYVIDILSVRYRTICSLSYLLFPKCL